MALLLITATSFSFKTNSNREKDLVNTTLSSCPSVSFGGIYNSSYAWVDNVQPNKDYYVIIYPHGMHNYYCLLRGFGYTVISSGCYDSGPTRWIKIRTNSFIGTGINLRMYGGCDLYGNFSNGTTSYKSIPAGNGGGQL